MEVMVNNFDIMYRDVIRKELSIKKSPNMF